MKIVEKRLNLLHENNPELLKATTTLSISGIMQLLSFLLHDCYFVWSKRLYRQTKGLPMGGCLSPVLAGIFMEELEERSLRLCPVVHILYKRYVDDIILSWDLNRGAYMILLDIMNDQNQNIRLTVEEENNGVLPFLDLNIMRPDTSKGRSYSLGIYCKDTHSDSYIHYRSSHPYSLKKNVLRGLLLRANRLLRNHLAKLESEFKHLLRVFTLERNGYPRTLVQKWIRQFQREV
ncbi:MAG: hypothetical protein GY861_27980, partial [bacterium]|nr:hypothetical protein [bacterium]